MNESKILAFGALRGLCDGRSLDLQLMKNIIETIRNCYYSHQGENTDEEKYLISELNSFLEGIENAEQPDGNNRQS